MRMQVVEAEVIAMSGYTATNNPNVFVSNGSAVVIMNDGKALEITTEEE